MKTNRTTQDLLAQMIEIRQEPAPCDPGDYYVAYVDDIRVGYLFIDRDLRGRIDADVHPSYRRRGIATALYLHAIDRRGSIESRRWEQSVDAQALWRSLAARAELRIEADGSYMRLSRSGRVGARREDDAADAVTTP